ncbi:MAG: calcium/sodium antiporter [Burkholderiaceae bacterium]|nr:calcium/sodium antiporter [Burkholderiaceae bacterium]MDP1968955.1 calcium/sodium antiporter [Burkholderiaceae bacterium]
MLLLHPALIFLGGLVVIVVGSEMVLRGASRIATLLRIRPIVIGLTVVSVGTSMPELGVGIAAAAEGRGVLAVGNIAGTNIFNILFILGLSAALRPLPLHRLSIRLDAPAMIATALALLIMAWDGMLSRGEGIFLLAAAVGYTIAVVHMSRHEPIAVRREFAEEYGSDGPKSLPEAALPQNRLGHGIWNGFLLLVGMAVTVLGAELLVSSAASIAKAYGVSDAFIGLTIVALGTSAPELATTLVATIKNDRDVAIGNLIGSGIYNVLAILGLTCVLSPGGVDVSRDILLIDLPLAAAVAVVCYPVFKSERLVSRREGIAFVSVYVAYFGSLLYLRH